MSHLNDDRLMALGLDPETAPNEVEAAHLEQCDDCAARLAEEYQLTALLSQQISRPVPSGFADRLATRFISESAPRVSVFPAMLFSALLAVVLVILMAWLIGGSPTDVVARVAAVAGKGATLIRAIYVVVTRVPFATEIVTVTSGATLLMCTGLLAGLMKRAAVWK